VNDGANKTSEASSNDEKWARFYEKVVGAWKDDEDIHHSWFAQINWSSRNATKVIGSQTLDK
jgi:PKD repeat protein